ncbi:MAG TPA: VanZ family protein [Terriglobales bacterium]|nr:VanZ family protein [Terriglobales bacterium]
MPALAWMGVVFVGSTDFFSSVNTGTLLMALLRVLVGSMDPATFFALHLALRKVAHVTVYAVLAVLWFRALRSGSRERYMRWALVALAVCLGVALMDETVQSFMPSRGASALDVGLDMLGASAAVASVFFRLRRQGPSLSC